MSVRSSALQDGPALGCGASRCLRTRPTLAPTGLIPGMGRPRRGPALGPRAVLCGRDELRRCTCKSESSCSSPSLTAESVFCRIERGHVLVSKQERVAVRGPRAADPPPVCSDGFGGDSPGSGFGGASVGPAGTRAQASLQGSGPLVLPSLRGTAAPGKTRVPCFWSCPSLPGPLCHGP